MTCKNMTGWTKNMTCKNMAGWTTNPFSIRLVGTRPPHLQEPPAKKHDLQKMSLQSNLVLSKPRL
jgi:hypothetical protein